MTDTDWEKGAFSAPQVAATDWEQGEFSAPASPGFIPTIKRTGGQMLTTAATAAEDVMGSNAVTRAVHDAGQGIIDRNPAGIRSLRDLVDSPWLAVKESVGQFAPQIAAARLGGVAGARVGGSLAGPVGAAAGGVIGGLAPIFTQEYGGIRQEQKEGGQEDKGRALIAAVPATALERVGMGKALNVLKGVPGGAASTILKEAGKGVLKEGATEGAQNVIEQWGAFKDPTTAENLEDTALSAAMGGIGGGVMGGAAGAVDGTRRRAQERADQQARQNAEAAAADAQAKADALVPPWTTEPGVADPNAEPGTGPAAAVNAPGVADADFTTSPGVADERAGMDFTREVDTSGLSLKDPAEVERARAATMDYEPGDATPQWSTEQGAAPARQGLDLPSPEIDTAGLSLDERAPSQRMGIDPSAGPLSRVAATAVDSGIGQEAQFLGATGRDLVQRRTGPGVADESNIIDVQGRVVEDRAIGTPRRLTDAASTAQPTTADVANPINRTGEPLRLNVAHALRNQAREAGIAAAVVAHPSGRGYDVVPQLPALAAQTAPPVVAAPGGAPFATRAAAQAELARQQLTDTHDVAPAGGDASLGFVLQSKGATPSAPASVTNTSPNATEAQRSPNWRSNAMQANRVARGLGIDTKGKRLAQVVAEIDAADAQQGAAAQPAAVHQDPGQPAEAATPAVVGQSITKAADNQGASPSQMRAWLLGEIDKAIVAAPADSRALQRDLAEAQKTGSRQLVQAAGNKIGYLTFDVPGDGTFKVLNTPEHLREFRERVQTSLGFKDNGQKRPAPERNPGVQNGSSTRQAALNALVEEGDFEAARDYAQATGQALEGVKAKGDRAKEWAAFLADGAQDRRAPSTTTATTANATESVAETADAKRAVGASIQPADTLANPRPSKPRMGESADEVWAAIKQAAGGVVSREGGSRLLYPTLRVVAGDSFRIDANGDLQVVDRKSGGVGVRDATNAEADEFHRDLNGDRVEVVLMTAPGYGSDYGHQKVVQVLHSPSGMSFEQRGRPNPVSHPKAETGQKPSAGAAPVSARIEDFGEELKGARKMLYAEAYADGMAQAKKMDAKAHPLSKTWPEPDYAKLLEGGAPLPAVSLARALREAVPTKPQSAWKLKGWVDKMQSLRSFAEDVLGGRTDAEEVGQQLRRAGILHVADKATLYEAMGHDRSLKGLDLSAGSYSMYDSVRYDPPRTIWTVAREAKGSAFGNWPRELAKGDTREEAIAAFKKRAAELLAEEQAPAKGATFEIYSKRAGGAREFFIGKKIGRNVAELKGGFTDLKTARQYKAEHQAELEGLLEKYKAVPPVRNAQNAPRIGQDYRKGADVTPEQFQEAFGFRGVQFGNYVEGSRRQQDLNQAYDGLMDLAGVLNLPPRALSLGGRLGLAFGARGSGGVDAAAAHYERGEVVINLTKKQGAGNLAHEWWHGLDNYFSRQRGDGGSYMTEDSRRGDGVREEMRAAFREVMAAINRTGMQERSRKLDDRRTKEYWTTKPEMSARAFESYVIGKLQDQNAGNDYLANVLGPGAFALEGGYPYPTAGELPQIRGAFDAFFQTVETRQGEDGAVVLYNTSDEAAPARGLSVEQAHQAVQQALAGLRNPPPIDIVGRSGEAWVGAPDGVMGAAIPEEGRIVVVASAHGSTDAVVETLFHEMFHLGVHKVLPTPDYVQSMLDLAKRDSRVQQYAIEWKEKAPDAPHQLRVMRERGYSGSELTARYEALAIEEGLAVVAEELRAQKQAGTKLGLRVRALANWLASVAERMGMQGLAERIRKMTYNEAERFVLKAIEHAGRKAGEQDGVRFRTADQTQTPAFKRWFGDSKAAQDGRPVVVYHGTGGDFDVFTRERAGATTGAANAGMGFFFTDRPEVAGNYARMAGGAQNIMPAYLSLQNPLRLKADNMMVADRLLQSDLQPGHDGAIIQVAMRDGGTQTVYMVRQAGQIKSATGNNGQFDPGNPDIRFRTAPAVASSMGPLTAAQERVWAKVAGVARVPTLQERAKALTQNFGVRAKQALVDQFAPIQDVSQEAYMLARLSKGADGTMEAAMLYGRPYLRDGVPDVDVKEGGFAKVLASLKGEHDRFLWWIAAQRAERLKAEGRENLMSIDDIGVLKTLNAGTMVDGTQRAPLYAKAAAQLNAFNESVLKMSLESGLIDQAAYDIMKEQPYVPFYRLMADGDMQGARFSSGLTNQNFAKKLKGGTEKLNADLLENLLLNWSHLYAATARNRAAVSTMDAAEKMGVAYPVREPVKGSVRVMRDGVAQHWMVEDPYLLEAVSALHYTASPLMKPLARMKQVLTWGVTVNPTFKIRNLIRDSLSAMAQSDLSYNPAANVKRGWELTASDSQVYASMLASGGVIKFGTQENSDRAREQVKKLGGVVLDQKGWQKLSGQLATVWNAYSELGDRAENVNRVALYDRLIAQGKSHAEASFMARDLMDFSMSGNHAVVRFLTQSVPFLNARLQGLYKLGRAAHDNPRRFAAVAGAVSMASLALLAIYGDDDDWKKREDWDRDSYWWFKIGDTAFRIPKPFEVGAIGTLAERSAELMLSKEMTNRRFMDRLGHMLAQTFAFDPMPQAFKPLVDIYSNQDSFTGRAIESQADQRLRPQDRYDERTSEVARLLGSWGLPDPVRFLKGEWSELSPKQVDHLLRGYFSWAGATAASVADTLARPALDRGERPEMRLKDVFVVGNFVESLPTGSSRYVTQMYEQARQAEQAHASYRDAVARGDLEKAEEIQHSEAAALRNRPAYANATRQLSALNQRAKAVMASTELSGAQKREQLDAIERQRAEVGHRMNALAIAP